MDLRAIQNEVGKWHIETFGDDVSNKRISRKLLEEAAEFMVANSMSSSVCFKAEEAADILIILMSWAHRNNVDLLSAVAEKFIIVKNRDQKERE